MTDETNDQRSYREGLEQAIMHAGPLVQANLCALYVSTVGALPVSVAQPVPRPRDPITFDIPAI